MSTSNTQKASPFSSFSPYGAPSPPCPLAFPDFELTMVILIRIPFPEVKEEEPCIMNFVLSLGRIKHESHCAPSLHWINDGWYIHVKWMQIVYLVSA